jgi:hypothetical protein
MVLQDLVNFHDSKLVNFKLQQIPTSGSGCVRVWNLMFVTSRDLSFMFMFGLAALQGV